jgi:hypothetical protein
MYVKFRGLPLQYDDQLHCVSENDFGSGYYQ